MIALFERPTDKPFEKSQLLTNGAVSHILCFAEKINIVVQALFIEIDKGGFSLELLDMVLNCCKLFVCRLSPIILLATLSNKLIEYLPETFLLLLHLLGWIYLIVKRIFDFFRSRHNILYLILLEYLLHYGIVTKQVGIDIRSTLLEFVCTAVLHSLFVCIPFSSINAIACRKLDTLARKNNSHSDGDVLNDGNTVFLTALQGKNDVSFNVHKLGALKSYTQNYTQFFIYQNAPYEFQ